MYTTSSAKAVSYDWEMKTAALWRWCQEYDFRSQVLQDRKKHSYINISLLLLLGNALGDREWRPELRNRKQSNRRGPKITWTLAKNKWTIPSRCSSRWNSIHSNRSAHLGINIVRVDPLRDLLFLVNRVHKICHDRAQSAALGRHVLKCPALQLTS
jgi:hypothetical protein